LEETGVEIGSVRALGYTNDVFGASSLHYVTLWMAGEYVSGEAMVEAPDEASRVGWYAWSALPGPLFLPLQNLIQGHAYLTELGRVCLRDRAECAAKSRAVPAGGTSCAKE
jgi:8-oxo-dGTP diphosphatase